jgi:hypothetical protein
MLPACLLRQPAVTEGAILLCGRALLWTRPSPATLYLLLPSPLENSSFLPSFNLFPNRNRKRNSH